RPVAADRARPAAAGALPADPAPTGHGHGIPPQHPAAPDPRRAATRPQPSRRWRGGGRVGSDGGPAAPGGPPPPPRPPRRAPPPPPPSRRWRGGGRVGSDGGPAAREGRTRPFAHRSER